MKLRSATPADASLLERWDEEPHVVSADPNDDWEWRVELERSPTWREQLIAEVDGRPIGVVQIIDPREEETHYWGDCPPNLRALDIWIGEEGDLGRGFGTRMMRLALERSFAAPSVTAVLVDPLESNVRARRFYERLGFEFVERRRFGHDDCAIYRLDRAGWQHSKGGTRILETTRLTLRPWRDEDLEPFAALNADPRVMQHFPQVLGRSESDALAATLRAELDRERFGIWAVERRDLSGRPFIGAIGLSVPRFEAAFTPCVEVAWRLTPTHWGQGLATEGARAAVEYGLGELGLAEVVAFTVPANVASRRVMEKLGMVRDHAGDFEHPRLPPGHPLRPHVLYRLRRT